MRKYNGVKSNNDLRPSLVLFEMYKELKRKHELANTWLEREMKRENPDQEWIIRYEVQRNTLLNLIDRFEWEFKFLGENGFISFQESK